VVFLVSLDISITTTNSSNSNTIAY